MRGERGVDLAELDAEAADLHLEVGAAEVLDDRRRRATRTRSPVRYIRVARPPERVGDEPLGGQRRAGRDSRGPAPAPARYSSPATPDGHRAQPRVQHERTDAAIGAPIGDRRRPGPQRGR